MSRISDVQQNLDLKTTASFSPKIEAQILDTVVGLVQENNDLLSKRPKRKSRLPTYAEFEKRHRELFGKGGLGTGLSSLDRVLDFKPGELNIIQAPSGHGKTSFMMQLVYNFLRSENNQKLNPTCLFVSYEADKYRVMERFLNMVSVSEESDKGAPLIRQEVGQDCRGKYLYPEKPEDAVACKKWDELAQNGRLEILDRVDLSELENEINEVKEKQPNRTVVLFLDYIQIMRTDEVRLIGWERIKEIAITLERIAIEHQVIIVGGSQVNADGDVREGRDIFFSASHVLSLFNHSHAKLLDSDKTRDKYSNPVNDKAIFSIGLIKSRSGATEYFQKKFEFDGSLITQNTLTNPQKTSDNQRYGSTNTTPSPFGTD